MMVLSELRETYWGADFTFRMFEKAKTKLQRASSNLAGSAIRTGNPSTDFSPTYSTTSPDLSMFMPSLDDLLAPELAFGSGAGAIFNDFHSM